MSDTYIRSLTQELTAFPDPSTASKLAIALYRHGYNPIASIWQTLQDAGQPQIVKNQCLVEAAKALDPAFNAFEESQLNLGVRRRNKTKTLRHHSRVNGVAFSPDGRILATAAHDGTARLWNIATGKKILFCRPGDYPSGRGVDRSGRDRGVARYFGVVFSPDGQILATGSSSLGRGGTAHLWNTATGDNLMTLTGHTGVHGQALVSGVAFSPDGQILATASHDGTARLWNPATGENLAILAASRYVVGGVAFSPDGRILATAGWDETVRLWDTATGDSLKILIGHTSWVSGVAFSPDGQILATSSGDMSARLWNPTTGDNLAILRHGSLGPGAPPWVTGVAFSPDGQILATASADGTARLWNPATGDNLAILTGHTGRVNGVAFSPDGRILATASTDNTARLWSLKSYL